MKKKSFTKTRNLILSAMLFLCCVQFFGQSYQSFFGAHTTKYHIFTPLTCYVSKIDSIDTDLLGCGGTFDYLITKGDTVMIGDTVYYNVGAYIREDTIKGQLFRYIKELNREFLVCDMSLNIGDTFRLPKYVEDDWGYYQYYYREEGEEIVVDSVAYINGKKVIYFSGIKDSPHYDITGWHRHYYFLTFIEGIGPTYGPFGYIYTSERYLSVLLCVEKDDTLTHITSPLLGCYQSAASIENLKTNPILLFPNPASDKIQLELNGKEFVNGTILIIDPIGQVVYSNVLTSMQAIIPITHLSSGIYVLQYNFNNQTFQTKFSKINKL
jgi:hypothetical protein